MLRATQRTFLAARAPFGAASAATRAMASKPTIIYTETDEAPNLATYSLLPIIKKMVTIAGIDVVKSDISLSGRVISQFPELLKPEQRIPDELTRLGKYTILCHQLSRSCIFFLQISHSFWLVYGCASSFLLAI